MTDDDSAPAPDKAPDAFRTISEVAEELDLPQHVLRFWETRFGQIRPMKRGGGRRYYRPQDVELLRGIRALLYSEGYTIKGVQRILKEQGPRSVIAAGRPEGEAPEAGPAQGAPPPTAPEIAAHAAPQTGPVQAVAPAVAPAPPRPAARTLPAGEAIPAVRRPAAPPRAEVAASERERDLPARPAGLGAAARRTLQATLAELLECKRLLDQAR